MMRHHAILVLVTFGLAAACAAGRATDRACEGMTREQCAWDRARRGAKATPGGDGAVGSAGVTVELQADRSWNRAEEILRATADWLAQGLGGAAVDTQVRQWCADPPAIVDKGHGPSWICHMSEPPRIAGRDLTLEGSGSGVLALAARELSGDHSRRLVEEALGRWSSWCTDARFSPIERFQDEEFHRCALPGGPLLVVGRFPQDLEADLWQVSLTVMGAA
jgi:hypothetical protein